VEDDDFEWDDDKAASNLADHISIFEKTRPFAEGF
jgi:uncharacterized DUF497 family protein